MDDDDEVGGGGAELVEMERVLGGEPLLGPRQAALVDAMVSRLGSGHPMSEADQTAFVWAAKTLRLLD